MNFVGHKFDCGVRVEDAGGLKMGLWEMRGGCNIGYRGVVVNVSAQRVLSRNKILFGLQRETSEINMHSGLKFH